MKLPCAHSGLGALGFIPFCIALHCAHAWARGVVLTTLCCVLLGHCGLGFILFYTVSP